MSVQSSSTRRLSIILAFASVGLLSCDQSEQLTAPLTTQFRADIIDGSTSVDRPHFFFLPPMVPWKPSFAGIFDASLSPVVEICEYDGDQCVGALIARFTMNKGGVFVDGKAEQYGVDWKTGGYSLDWRKIYRIRVLVDDTEFGAADVRFVKNWFEEERVDPTRFVRVVYGDMLPIRFRIELGAIVLPVGMGSVSAGYHHTCAVTTAGAAHCWGVNTSGNLGDGTNLLSRIPVAVSGGYNFVAISAGSVGGGNAAHTCALTDVGAAYCWGLGLSGQLGDGLSSNSNVPVAVAGGITFKQISAGEQYACGLTIAGAAYCWGANGYGQLGDGTQNVATMPVAVAGGLTFKQISAGGHHTCGVTTSNDLYCWGSNGRGQLGLGTMLGYKLTPQKVYSGYLMVTAGSNHTCALNTYNDALCWGSNAYGELGDGTQTQSSFPVVVFGSGVHKFKSIDAGFFSQPGGLAPGGRTCAISSTGAAYCWGHNYGALGNGTNTGIETRPVAVSGGLTFRNVSVGEDHACGVTTLGEVYCWGGNAFGQFGNGLSGSSNVPVAGGNAMTFARVRAPQY